MFRGCIGKAAATHDFYITLAHQRSFLGLEQLEKRKKTQRNYLQSPSCEIFKIINLARTEKRLVKRRGDAISVSLPPAAALPTADPPRSLQEGALADASQHVGFGVDAPVPALPQPLGLFRGWF